jgi:hypothetical protein
MHGFASGGPMRQEVAQEPWITPAASHPAAASASGKVAEHPPIQESLDEYQ